MSDTGERPLTPRVMRVLGRVLDTIPALINVKDRERRYVFVNRYLYEYYGDTPDHVLGQTAGEIMPAAVAAAVDAEDLAVLRSGRPTGMREDEDTDRDGRQRRWLIGKWPLSDGAGTVTNIVTVGFDITQLHEAREAGVERVRMLDRVISQAPLMLLKTVLWPDGSTTVPFIAGRLAEIFDIDRDAAARKTHPMTALIHPDDRQAVGGQWQQAITHGSRFTCEYRATDRSGRERWLSATASQRCEEDGRTVLDEVIVDITELHAARQLARQSEEQLHSLAHNVPGLIARRITRPDGSATIPFLSGDYIERLGIDPHAVAMDASLVGQTMHPADRDGEARAWRASLSTLQPFDHTSRFIGRDGTVGWYRTRAYHQRIANGDIVSDMLTLDVSEEKRAERELQQERELFQSVASHVPGLIFRRTSPDDGPMRYDYIEGALLDILGVDREMVRGDPELLWQHFTAEGVASARAVLMDSMASLQPYSVLLRCRPPEYAQDIYVEVTGRPRRTDGAVVVDGIAVDVTTRKMAEAEADAQRFLLQQVIDAVPAAINVKNNAGLIELANQTLADYYGVSPSDLVGEAGQAISDPPEDEAQTRAWDEAVMRTGDVTEAREYAYVDSHGRTRHWLGRKSPLRNPHTGKVERVVTVSLDVTDRVTAEERARQHVELLQSVATNIPGAVLRWRLAPDDSVTQEFAAGRFVENGHIDGGRAQGTIAAIWPALDAEDAANLASTLQAPPVSRGSVELELRMRVDDETRWMKLFGSPRDMTGRDTAWDLIVLDATESKRYEEQLRVAQKMDAIGNLTGGIAHDFNNILAVIVANLDLLLDLGLLDAEGGQVADAALRAAERGAELTGRLLAFARNQPAEASTFACDPQIEGFARFMRRSLGPEIVLDLDFEAQSPRITVDPGQFENALMNLVVNARDAMDGRGLIAISSELVCLEPEDQRPASLEPGCYAVVSVTDSGAGMSPEVLRRAFEPLFTTKTEGRGTGFGLPMVYNFARQAGGLVTLYSEPGHGTTARLYLPAADAAGAEREQDAAPCGPAPVRGEDVHILLVDDNTEARIALARQLQRHGFRITQAESASQALAIAQLEDDIDLLITDIIMPGAMNGAELADRLHQDRPGLPILLTSGYPSDALAARQMTRGRFEMLGKPFRERDLLAAVGRMLERAGG